MTINAWKEDTQGKYFEMQVGAIKDYGVDVSDWLDSDDTLVPALCVWSLQAGITVSSPSAIGKLCRAILHATTTGVFSGSLTISSANGLNEILPFRVVVK